MSGASSVWRVLPETVFLLIGDGQERSQLEQVVREAGLDKNVLFLGSRKDIPELLACCCLSVLPSESEALPNALLEAMASGLPVVATCVGGAREIINHGINGLLVPPQNPQALAAESLRILRGPPPALSVVRLGQGQMRHQS